MPSKKYRPDPFVSAACEAFKARGIDVGEVRGQLPGKIYHLFDFYHLRAEFGHIGHRPTDNSPRKVFLYIHNGSEAEVILRHNGGARLTVEFHESLCSAFQTFDGRNEAVDNGTMLRIHSSSAKLSRWIDAVNATIDAIVANHGPTPSRT